MTNENETPPLPPNGVGPTGTFPNGQLKTDDEGGIAIHISADKTKNVVMMQFGKPISWLAFDPGSLERFVAKLNEKLKELQT